MKHQFSCHHTELIPLQTDLRIVSVKYIHILLQNEKIKINTQIENILLGPQLTTHRITINNSQLDWKPAIKYFELALDRTFNNHVERDYL